MTDLAEPDAAPADPPSHPADASERAGPARASAEAADDGRRSRYPFGVPFGWYMVAWSHELSPGTVLPRYYFGRHLVVWRDDQGGAHVQDAFCPHLGAHLGHGGRVTGTELECPFHGWRFDGDGRNTCIPYSSRTNARARIRSYPVVELADHFVMMWFHPHGAPPAWEVSLPPEAHSEQFTDWRTVELAVAAGQQELAENTVDGPHFRYVHDTEIVPEIESYETDGFVARTRTIQRFPTPRGVVDGRIDIENQGPGFGFTWFRGIVDTLLVGCPIPVDDGHTIVRFNFKVRRLGDEASTSSVGEAFIREVVKQFEEDRPIWEHKAHLVRPALADTDPPYLRFRRWYAQFYADGTADAPELWPPPPPPPGAQPEHRPPAKATAGARHRPST